MKSRTINKRSSKVSIKASSLKIGEFGIITNNFASSGWLLQAQFNNNKKVLVLLNVCSTPFFKIKDRYVNYCDNFNFTMVKKISREEALTIMQSNKSNLIFLF